MDKTANLIRLSAILIVRILFTLAKSKITC